MKTSYAILVLALSLVAAPAWADMGATSGKGGKKGDSAAAAADAGANRIDSGSGSGDGSAANKVDNIVDNTVDGMGMGKKDKGPKGSKTHKAGKKLSAGMSTSSLASNGAFIAVGAGCVVVALVAVARRRSRQQASYTMIDQVAVDGLKPNNGNDLTEKTPLVV